MPPFRLPWRTRSLVVSEVEEELRYHLDLVAARLRAAGMSEAEARAEAERRFGDLEATRNYCRDELLRREREKRRMTVLDELHQDLHYAIRALRRSPGFTLTALLTLGLGIGANTAIFSVVRAVLLEPLAFRDAGRIVRVWQVNPSTGMDRGAVSEPNFKDWRAGSRLTEAMGGFFYADRATGMDLTGQGDPVQLNAALVTDGFFETLETPPLLGRALLPEDNVPGKDRVAMLSYSLWTGRFGADRSLPGRSITLNGQPFVVAGVMPAGFTYPADRNIDLWIPLSFFGPDAIGRERSKGFLEVIARMKPGVTSATLHAELAGVAARLAREYPENPGWTDVFVAPIRDSILGEVRTPLLVLMVAVGLVLLITCVNIASLLLARATGRRRELAVRAALGAGRGRIARQLLTESMTLAIAGGGLGVIGGLLAVRALAASGGAELPRADAIRVDGWVMAFTFGISVISGLLFGTVPVVRASSGHLHAALRAGARGSVGNTGQKLRSALVVVEVALAVILVIGAGLATKSFGRLVSVNPGFHPENGLVMRIRVGDAYQTDEARLGFYQTVLERVRAVPGVQAAGVIRDLPLRGNGELVRPGIQGRPLPPGQAPAAQLHQVSTDYFKAMGIPLLAGRSFEPTDRGGAPPVLVVSHELARRFWPGENAVGKFLTFGTQAVEVVGVVGDVRQRGLAEPPEPTLYIHALQNPRSGMSIVARTAGDPLRYANAVRQAIWSVDKSLPIIEVTTLDAVVGRAVSRPRLIAWLLALFGAIGLSLGALGIYGVLAYAVNQRRQEIGVRVALGASPRSVLSLVVGRGMLLAAVGVVVGVGGAWILTRSMQTVLYDIRPSDPVTFVEVVLILLVTSLLASWLPARRALEIDPVTALRAD
ncbi:MAG TPA: ABC transporter permease [Gemmatimonadales bacterium]|nr:ABC transporter permease [Gemmatimonadales bacterium]